MTHFIRLGRAVRAPAGGDLLDVLAAWTPVLPDGAMFTGLTACQVYGWWLPPLPSGLRPHLASPVDGAGTRHRGLDAVRCVGLPRPWLLGDIPIAPPAEALLGAGTRVGHLDLVVLVDSALRSGRLDLDTLVEVARIRRRGAPALRGAIADSDPRSESAWETILRLMHTTAGVAVTPQAVVLDDALGQIRADLLVDGTRLLQEYDGGHHRNLETYRSDRARDARLAEAGWLRRGWTAPDVARHPEAVLLQAWTAKGTTPDARKLRPWRRLWADSLFGGRKVGANQG